MKHMDFSVLTVGTILLSVFGLCLLPFLCFGDQYIDSVTGFSMGSGYLRVPMQDLTRFPLVFLPAILCADLVLAVDCLVWQRGRRSY
ncbi:MAG: hypothetical protein PUE63_02515 [Lachnospiraceae bacterium]|nr:hypothetical protein [Lachnospiraceae bacterium]